MAGIGLGLTGLASTATGAVASARTPQYLKFFNDKAPWVNQINATGKLMAKSFGLGFQSVPYSSDAAYEAVLRSSLATSKAPALFSWWSGYQIQSLVKNGLAVNLTPEWKQWSKLGVNPEIAKAFEVNGKYYGAPLYAAYWVVFYNTKVFHRYGLTPPTTWAQFMHLCAVLKSHGVAPLVSYSGPSFLGFAYFENFLIGSDPGLYDRLMAGKASYTSPGVVKVMKLWKHLIDLGYFASPNELTATDFARGKVAMMLIGQWYESSLLSAGLKPGSGYGAFLMPSSNPKAGKQVIFETGPVVVAAHSPQKALAIQALNDFMRPGIQQEWDNLQGFPPLEKAIKSENSVNLALAREVANGYKLHNRYWEATPPQISQYGSTQFIRFVLNPSQYMQVLRNIQSYASQYWKSHR